MKDFNTAELFSIASDEQFNRLAIGLFRLQHEANPVYREYCDRLKFRVEEIAHYSQIPFLPVEFFRTKEVVCGKFKAQATIFTSSSTSSQTPSQHIVTDVSVYEKSFLEGFRFAYGEPSDYTILALLPGYLERSGSSLVYMVDHLIRLSKQPESGFFLHDLAQLRKSLEEAQEKKKKTILIGVSYALLDLAETGISLSDDVIVMETGGMKGKRKELPKEELHEVLKKKLGIQEVHSEYGMTELLSQAYSKGGGKFTCPPWMRLLTRDPGDPLSIRMNGERGGVNIIDLANINSCAFIATKDLGRTKDGIHFELNGRFDNSDIRGCNLMIE